MTIASYKWKLPVISANCQLLRRIAYNSCLRKVIFRKFFSANLIKEWKFSWQIQATLVSFSVKIYIHSNRYRVWRVTSTPWNLSKRAMISYHDEPWSSDVLKISVLGSINNFFLLKRTYNYHPLHCGLFTGPIKIITSNCQL